MIPFGNMDRSTDLTLHLTGTIINQIHNLFCHVNHLFRMSFPVISLYGFDSGRNPFASCGHLV